MWFPVRAKQPVITLGTFGKWPFDFWPLPFGLFFVRRFYNLKTKDRQAHKHIMGISESGKSFLLAKMIVDMIMQGIPVSVIDPHNDLAHDILRLLFERGYFNRKDAFQKLWYVDLARRDCSIPWNVLMQTDGKGQPVPLDVVAENMKDVLKRFFPAMSGGAAPVFENIVQYSAVCLRANGLPLTKIGRLLTDFDWRESLLANCLHAQTLEFFHTRFDKWDAKKRAEDIESTLNKISIITLSEPLWGCLSQRENALDHRRIIDRGISVIYNLGELSEDAKKLAGCFLASSYEKAALARSDMPETAARREHQLVIDEFASFANAESLSTILSQVRKYKLYLTLAHQTWDQLSEKLQSAVQNVRLSIFFALGYTDAQFIAPHVGRADPYHKKHEVKPMPGHEIGIEHHPVYFQQQEEYEEWTRRIENLWDREAYVKKKRKLPRVLQLFLKPYTIKKIRTMKVPRQTCKPEELQKIKEYYVKLLHKPFTAKDHTSDVTASTPLLPRRAPCQSKK